MRLRPTNQEDIERLAKSIHTVGLITPPVVYASESDKGMHILVAGAHRIHALRMLKEETVEVKVCDRADASIIEIVENLHRNDLKKEERVEHTTQLYKEMKLRLKDGVISEVVERCVDNGNLSPIDKDEVTAIASGAKEIEDASKARVEKIAKTALNEIEKKAKSAVVESLDVTLKTVNRAIRESSNREKEQKAAKVDGLMNGDTTKSHVPVIKRNDSDLQSQSAKVHRQITNELTTLIFSLSTEVKKISEQSEELELLTKSYNKDADKSLTLKHTKQLEKTKALLLMLQSMELD